MAVEHANADPLKAWEKQDLAEKAVTERMPPIRQALEREFRKILGVEDIEADAT